jgi:hypothetical protein
VGWMECFGNMKGSKVLWIGAYLLGYYGNAAPTRWILLLVEVLANCRDFFLVFIGMLSYSFVGNIVHCFLMRNVFFFFFHKVGTLLAVN